MSEHNPFHNASAPGKGTKMRGARAVLETLRAFNTEYVFGVPGSSFPIYAEFAGRSDIKPIMTRDERGAACMADGYARISHRPGVCSAVEGPGTTNLLTGIGEAWMSSIPVVAITGARSPADTDKNPIMFCRGRVHDTFDVLKPYTKWSVQVHKPERVSELISRAFSVATSGRPGPVQVELFPEAIYEEWTYDINPDPQYGTWPNHRTWPDPALCAQAAELLLSAKRPVIVSGGGVIHAQAWDDLIALAEHLSIPVATSLFGKGSIPETHPLAVGVSGIHFRKSANEIVSAADVVMFVGSNTDMHTTNRWTIPMPGEVKVIHIDVDSEEIGRNYPTEVGIVADARSALQGVLAAIRERQPEAVKSKERLSAVKTSVDAWRKGVAPMQKCDATPIVPQRLIREMMDFLDDDAILLGDLSFSSVWLNVHYDMRLPGRNIIYARGFDLLGWGLPASLGAKLAAPDRQVCSLIGDGSMGYCIGELETARRYNIPAVNIVLNNGTLGYEKFLIKYFNEPGKLTEEYPGCDYSDTDYAAIARAFGCVGIRVERPEEIRPALEEAFASNKPAVIDVVIDADIVPPISFFPESDRSL